MKYKKSIILTLMVSAIVYGQTPIRVGTTAAEFLGVGYGPAGVAMGDAYVSMAQDISSTYWNPAGLAFMNQTEVMFAYQPWIADINTYYSAAGLTLPTVGSLAIGVLGVNYGEMEVTTVDMQTGTGELFSAGDYAFTLSYGRRLASWFGFGATAKYVRSSIWHTAASAMAVDLGVLIQTPFFSTSGDEEKGLRIGMSLSNYGTRMKYGGIDLLNSVDLLPDEAGNYKDTKVYYAADEWELPLIFRVGVSVLPIATYRHELALSVDALHVNNNSESVNVGAEYKLNAPGMGKFFLRGGYRALFLVDSEFGPTAGVGFQLILPGKTAVQVDYTYRDIGLLGYVNTFGVCLKL